MTMAPSFASVKCESTTRASSDVTSIGTIYDKPISEAVTEATIH
jgi:hypothetical protein